MNNDRDYLWDKTGEPDPDIQQLEEILGTLRYQPKALEIPAGLQVGRQRNFFHDFGPRLAIAATIAMLLVGLGLWFGLHRGQPAEVAENPKAPAVKSNPIPSTGPSPNENQKPSLVASSPVTNQEPTEAPRRHRVNRSLAGNSNRIPKDAVKDSQLAENLRDGEAAKEQLMLALRLAGAKLNFVQKKLQTTSPRDLIHNQHKIG